MAEAEFRKAFQIYNASGNRPVQAARALRGLADLARSNKEYGKAVELFQQAADLFAKDPTENYRQGLSLEAVGDIYVELKADEQAAAFYEKAAAYARDRTSIDRRGEARAVKALALIYQRRKDYAGALKLLERSAGLYNEAGNSREKDEVELLIRDIKAQMSNPH